MKTNSSCPTWHYDDVTNCTRNIYLDGYYPLIVGGTSFLVLSSKSLHYLYKHRNGNSINKINGSEQQPLLNNSDAYGSIDQKENEPEITIKQRHFDLTRLSDTNEDGTPHGYSKLVYKTSSDRFRVAFEFLLVALNLSVQTYAVFFSKPLFHSLSKYFSYTPYIQLLFWLHAFIIVTIRIINLYKVQVYLPSLWSHSTFLYFFNFFPALISFRSALINSTIKQSQTSLINYYKIEFIIAITLVILNFSSTAGDKPAVLYLTSDGVTPSPENVSSLFSFISYSWLDPMVWKSYQQPLTMNDIWGLREDDYTFEILKSFARTSKKSASFTYKLFNHFKYLLAIQFFWAILEAFLIFVPSLLLKQILEYVDDPEHNSKNLAWCFVLIMPCVKMLDSIASGCSLFIGRRVCLRMKSIIIGEVYAKALRRRITVSETGENKEEEVQTEGADAKQEPEFDSKSATSETKKTAELGAIINLMAIDAFKVSEICGYLHFFVGSILMIFICIYLLYGLLGWSALVGSATIAVLFPINYKLASYVGRLQKTMLEITDKRIQKLNETFQSIRIIKFFAWEDQFYDSIMEVRAKELYYLGLRTLSWCLGSTVWFITPTLITFFSFYCYTIVEGKPLTAPIAFTALSLFSLLRSPLDQLSDMTAIVIQSKVSLDRVDDFLNEEETTKYEQLAQEKSASSPEVGFENASFSWNSKVDNDFKLRDLNIEFKSGKLNVVIGATGAGKTSLLLALLGEMELTKGKVFLPGIIPRDELVADSSTGLTESVAYCSQAAWLLNDSIRNNIVFAAPFNQERYDKVVDACGLTRDFEILSGGDATEIGEKGITLSGGQKQRVSLARALYSNSKNVLLDDCLSAVDSHTALWIYENCISGPLMQERTCILVSHNVALTVQNAEWVVVMDNGRVKVQGSPEELLNSGDLGDDDLVKSSVINSRSQSSTNLKALEDKNADLKAKSATIEAKIKAAAAAAEASGAFIVDADDGKKTDGKLVEEETKSDGVVSMKVYSEYAKALGGWKTWTFVLFAFLASQVVYMMQSFWLRKWSAASGVETKLTQVAIAAVGSVYNGFEIGSISQPMIRMFVGIYDVIVNFISELRGNSASVLTIILSENPISSEPKSTLYYISIYGAIGLVYAIFASLRVLVTFFAGIWASNRIFKDVLNTVLRAKLRFFDKTPQGRIMNRFSKDIEAIDQELTPQAEGVFACFVSCASTLILIVFITPGFLFFAVLIAFLYYLVGVFYVSASRELKRYESITKSPIHQHFSESLNGVATIRAYGVEGRFMKHNLQAIDNNNRPFFYLWVANRWLSFRVDAVGSLVMFTSAIFIMLSVGNIDAGLAGLTLSYAIAFSESALWIVRLYANMEMNMNSVERLQEYLEIEQEPPYEIPENEPRPTWPEKGAISVSDVSLRYAPELPRVIKNVSFDVEPCHKIGIVGRTGAGKSTIITAFFRFIDPETGSIKIDGVDITQIGLKNLRQAITIIPQDPTLFTGTIRSNLDPFNQYTDAQIFEALKRVNLIGHDEFSDTANEDGENQNKFLNLENAVTEGGGNLSQGQRQLMCLGRSLLKSPKVILLDEATASIDYKSDAMIQQTIRDEFSNSTILTIAHRLRSIIDYDKILVMDAGQVAEYDEPYKLIADKDSLFYSMCENSGELDSLTKLAKESFVEKKNKVNNQQKK